jgi:hypothetical protein
MSRLCRATVAGDDRKVSVHGVGGISLIARGGACPTPGGDREVAIGVTPKGWTASGFGIDQAASVLLLELDRAAVSER